MTRNDDHGGDPLKRLQAFVNTFDAQTRRTGLDAELVVVEWNPPTDRPRLHELVRMPAGCPFPIRFIEVPAPLHERIPFGHVLPLFQMIGKNVGIRRARGRFVLSTNIDIILSNELVEYLASGQLAPGRHYRVDRHDIEPDYPVTGSLDEQMEYCRTHQLRLHTRAGTHRLDRTGNIATLTPDVAEAPLVELGAGWHVREGDASAGVYRWVTEETTMLVDRTLVPERERQAALAIDVEANPYQPNAWVKIEVLEAGHRLALRRVSGRVTLWVTLDDDAVKHELTLRMLDSSGGRDALPLFERRERLCYRIHRIQLAREGSHPYGMERWRRATASPHLSIEQTGAGIVVVTDPGKFSYAARYGPFHSRADATYDFLLPYVCDEGNLSLQAMDDDGQRWLTGRVSDIDDGVIIRRNLSVEVAAGTTFSLFVSNNRPDGDAVSRFTLGCLTGSVPVEDLLRTDDSSAAPEPVGVKDVFAKLVAPFGQLRSRASSIALEQARERYEVPIVENSDTVRELERRLREGQPLQELASMEQFLRANRPPGLHQNASGDFQLLAREHWFELRGFAEFPMYSMNIDGLFESTAHGAGIQEHALEMPLCIYHLEHEKGSGWTPEGEALLKQRMAESGITWLDARAVHIWSAYMQWLHRPMIFNGSDWGFGDIELRETLSNAAVKQA